ncbi:MAG: response regulator [Planctomycetota bacterium]|jgi:CheY-like chemotaxis protein
MTSARPRLVVLKGTLTSDERRIDALTSAFEVVEVENLAAALTALAESGPDGLLLPSGEGGMGAAIATSSVLQHIGEGVGVVASDGRVLWSNDRLSGTDEQTRRHFLDLCREAIGLFNEAGVAEMPFERQLSRKFLFESGDHSYELVVSTASVSGDEGAQVESVVGVLVDVTASRRLQYKIDAIDAAGSELMRIESSRIANLNMADRLKLLEEKIVHYVHDLLHFDNFEIRLLDPQTNQLELVISVGLSPLKIGEVMYAEAEGHGISGYVAATDQSYVCPDVQKDPRYREGLDNARSSLTVPLRLHDRVIGVFNIESNTPSTFDEYDRQFAEIFGRYIAMAMNILDLLVVERFTTNEQLAENVLGELSEPIDRVASLTDALQEVNTDDPRLRQDIEAIADAVDVIRARVERCRAGPRTILGAEQALRELKPDPLMTGRRVLVADNEQVIRETLAEILRQTGCDVTVCGDGVSTIEAVRLSGEQSLPFDLVISDIKMPDRNGYEIFRMTKSISASTPVILMTGFGYDPYHSIVRASQEGLQALLFKPFKATQLLEAVAKAFQ